MGNLKIKKNTNGGFILPAAYGCDKVAFGFRKLVLWVLEKVYLRLSRMN